MKPIEMFLSLLLSAFISLTALAGSNTYRDTEMDSSFNVIAEVPHTKVKDQHQSGTCWSFAAVSFLEAEILRKTGMETDLSEMFFVRHAYPLKAEKYVRFHGRTNFGPGGQAHDVLDVMARSGIVMEGAYTGLTGSSTKHDHGELDAVLKSMLDAVLRQKSKGLTGSWKKALEGTLDAYLGELPQKFQFNGQEWDPLTFRDGMKLSASDYVELTSFSHHPYYKSFALEIPDNWSNGSYINLPLEEFINVIEYALRSGYSVVWDGDVSHSGFQFKEGYATVPLHDNTIEKYESEGGLKASLPATIATGELAACEAEEFIDQKIRQEQFDQLISTDDHLMHIVGLVEGPSGKYFFKIKNSWSEKKNSFGGYIYATEEYLKLNTIAIMVHKDALPADTRKRIASE